MTRAKADGGRTAHTTGPWQTIETAPKDGSKVDLLYPYPRGRTIDCFWQEGGVYGDGGWCWLTPSWVENGLEPESEWSRNSYPNMEPTHWMPAPATLTEQPSEAPPSALDVREALYKAIYEANGCTLNDGEAVRRAIDITISARPSTPPVADRGAIIRECASVAADHTPKKFEGTLAAHATGRAIECAILALLSAQPAKGER